MTDRNVAARSSCIDGFVSGSAKTADTSVTKGSSSTGSSGKTVSHSATEDSSSVHGAASGAAKTASTTPTKSASSNATTSAQGAIKDSSNTDDATSGFAKAAKVTATESGRLPDQLPGPVIRMLFRRESLVAMSQRQAV